MYIQFRCSCLDYNYDIIHRFTYKKDNLDYLYEKCDIYFKNVFFKEIYEPISYNYINYANDDRFKFIQIRNCVCNKYIEVPKIYDFSIYLSESEMCYIIKNIDFSLNNNHI